MSDRSKIIYFFISVIFFILFDVFFSGVILNNTANFPQNPILDLIFIQNTGAAFNILQNSKEFLIAFSAVAALGIIIYTIKHISKTSTVGLFWLSLLVAGITCNMGERIVFGFVRDFFKLNFVNFPVFNISDIFINLSVFAIVVIIIKNNYSKNNETNN